MTVPCVPPIVAVSRAARAAWRLRHPFRRIVHPHGVASPTPPRLSGKCEGVVGPEGGRTLPALPGAKQAAIVAGTAAAAGGAAFAAGAALAGAGGGLGGGGGGSGTPGSFVGSPSNAGFASLTGPSAKGMSGIARTVVPDIVGVTAADTAEVVPAPGVAVLFGVITLVTIIIRSTGPRRAG